MRILVTGADGLLGSNLVRILLDRGHDVSVFLFPESRSTTLSGLNITKYYGDILKPESLENAVKQNDAVIHAAASTSIWPSKSQKTREVNIQGTQNIIDLALKYKINRLIYIGSASSVNGKSSNNKKYRYPGEKFGLDYIDSKYEALKLVLNAIKTKNLPAIAILPTFMIGAYDSLPSSGKMILATAQGKLKYYSGGGRNFVYVNDVTTAIANSLELKTTGKWYIAGNENLSYKDFFDKVSNIVETPPPKIKTPDFAIKTVGFFGSLFGKLFKKQPLISYPTALIACENQFTSNENTLDELKMPQTPIEFAIEECYKWFIDNGYL